MLLENFLFLIVQRYLSIFLRNFSSFWHFLIFQRHFFSFSVTLFGFPMRVFDPPTRLFNFSVKVFGDTFQSSSNTFQFFGDTSQFFGNTFQFSVDGFRILVFNHLGFFLGIMDSSLSDLMEGEYFTGGLPFETVMAKVSPTTTSSNLPYAPYPSATDLVSMISSEDIAYIALIFRISKVFKG